MQYYFRIQGEYSGISINCDFLKNRTLTALSVIHSKESFWNTAVSLLVSAEDVDALIFGRYKYDSLHKKGDFGDVINLGNLRRLYWIILMGLM